jgi:hypothetical protein
MGGGYGVGSVSPSKLKNKGDAANKENAIPV